LVFPFISRSDCFEVQWKALVATVLNTISTPFFWHVPHQRSLLLMAAALGLRDKETHAHAQRVAAYAGRLAERVGLPVRDIIQITLGGMLHDVGKLALSDRIFSNEKAALSEEMLWEVRSHPLLGAALLRRINCTGTISDVVLYHHERINGSGYPFGLKSESIPLSARIVSIADCFDAITSNRPYQKRKSCKEAFAVLCDSAGVGLDPDLVPAFIKDVRRNGMIRLRQHKLGGYGAHS
jgi:putative nucleotidyltransferase with HDIG domain